MFANNSDFFDGSQGQSVIVRQQSQHEAHQDEDFSSFPVNGGSSCLPSTPITPTYSAYPGQLPFSFLHPDIAQTFQSFFPPPDHGCNPALGNLNSPLLPGSALGGSLNHLNNRIPGVSRSSLPYDFPGSASNFMGGTKQRKGGRRPGDEMVNEDCDPEEADKRQKRRQRNKEAAARCRQRRLDLMQSLQEQVARERDANLQKEKEIASVKQSLEKVVDFLRGHLAHLPETDKIKFEEIASLLHKDHSHSHSNGHVFKTEPIDPPSINDYLNQHAAIHRVTHKRSALPSASDISILEPELKKVFQIPKFDLGNPTLGQVNGAADPEVSRPTTLDISALQRTAAPLAATPSNGLYTSSGLPSFRGDAGGMYTSLFNTGADGQPHFLCQSTGLTPSAAPTVGFVAQTPTPLQTSEADLRPL